MFNRSAKVTMRHLTLFLLVAIAVVRTGAQSVPPIDPKIVLRLSLETNQREFHIGEIIPRQLSFSSSVKNHYQINVAQYDRSGRPIQRLLAGYLKMWEDPVVSISFEHGSEPFPFHARVAQYEFQSPDALKDKLAQFPSGTEFFLSSPPVESPANDQMRIELRTFLSSHGMSLAAEKRVH